MSDPYLQFAQSGFGRVTWRRKTAISCRSTKISTSLEVSLRASSTTQPNNRIMSRYRRRMSTTAEDRSPGQVLCSSSGTPQAVMARKRRKTLIVCRPCHDYIHANPVANAAQSLESPVH